MSEPVNETVPEGWPGQDLVIHAPCATAAAVAPMHETEEAGDGLD